MRIKTNPEDFRVREKISLPIGGGDFTVYLLKKRNWNTVDAIRAACKEKHVPLEKVRWGGRKDKYAVTEQFLTCPAEYDLSFKRHNVLVEKFGTSPEQMSPRKIIGNEFCVAIRDMSENETLNIPSDGFVNYFDEQRFGGNKIFLAELLVKRQFDRALKMWVCRGRADGEDNSRNGIIRALRLIPREEFGMFVSAYQSHIWNEVCKKVISKGIDAFEIPTVAPEILPAPPEIMSVISDVLNERGVRLSKLKLSEFSELGYFSSFMRKIKVFPEGLEISEHDDEIFKGRRKAELKFTLPAGSYATMFLKGFIE